ncbi:MAG: hypothetical protein J6S23_02020 [Clostridia bacterium]|nr:hypothetical protein [Clostridia bacterium]
MKKHYNTSHKILVVIIILTIALSIFSACAPIDNPTTTNDASSTQNPPANTTIPDDIVKKPHSITCLAGTLEGNIVIDTGDNYKFYL